MILQIAIAMKTFKIGLLQLSPWFTMIDAFMDLLETKVFCSQTVCNNCKLAEAEKNRK